jgi:hypothetical protein
LARAPAALARSAPGFSARAQTLIAWHRLGFGLFWRWKSRTRGGRPAVDRKLINLIRRMWFRNPTWGSKRIQAELAKLGIEVSDSTIRKYRPRTRRADQIRKTFLNSHAKDLIAVDFFVVPTANLRLLHVFLVLAHERRKVPHLNITDSPSAAWSAQQLPEAFPYANPPRYAYSPSPGSIEDGPVTGTRDMFVSKKVRGRACRVEMAAIADAGVKRAIAVNHIQRLCPDNQK